MNSRSATAAPEFAVCANRAVQANDLGRAGSLKPPVLVTLDTMEHVLVHNPLTKAKFTPVNGRDGVYRLGAGEGPRLVTFSRKAADDASDDTTLLTYGNADLDTLLRISLIADPAGI